MSQYKRNRRAAYLLFSVILFSLLIILAPNTVAFHEASEAVAGAERATPGTTNDRATNPVTSVSSEDAGQKLFIPAIASPGGTASTVIGGVPVTIASHFLPNEVVSFAPNDAIQLASAITITPFQELTVISTPYGEAPVTEDLPIASPGGAQTYRNALADYRIKQGGTPTPAPTASIFGQSIVGSYSVVNLPLNSQVLKQTLIVEWVAEYQSHFWIVRAVRDLSDGTHPGTILDSLHGLSIDVDTAATGPQSNDISAVPPVQSEGNASVQSTTALPVPPWWSGDCNVGNHPNSFRLGAVYDGLVACGPVRTEVEVNFGKGVPQLEWQCTELAKRYLFLKFDISPYSAHGKDVVNNMPQQYIGTTFDRVSNGTPNQAPGAGDVISFGPTTTAGHVAIVTSSNVDSNGNGTIQIIEQNAVASGARSLPVKSWQVGGSMAVSNWLHVKTQPNEPATMDIAIIIDSSGSMMSNDPANLRLDAARVFAGVMLNGDQAAVVGFDTNAYVRFGMQPLTNNRSAIMSAISSIGSSGGSTNIVAGLNVAYAQLNGSTKAVPKAAVLLTDGQHNVGAWNTSSYTQYVAKGWPVFTIGLGGGADEIRLKQIASATGGQYYKLSDPSQLVQIYYAIQAAITGSSIITSSSFNLQQGQTETLNSAVSSNQNSVSFVTTWPGSQVDVTLQDPNGRVITPNTPSSDPNVYHSKGATYEVYRVDYPPQGTWKIVVYGAILDPGGETVTVQVAQRDDQLPSGAWQEVSPGSASGGGVSNTNGDSIRPAIAAAPDGSIYAVWAEDVGSQAEIYVLRWNGSAWTTVGNGSASGGGISQTSGKSEDPEIAIDSNGVVYVAWHDKGGNDTDIYVRRWNGSQWSEVGAGSASGEGISKTNTNSLRASIQVAPDNSVYVAWHEEEVSDFEIYVRRWNGSSWNPVGTNSASNGGISNNSGDSSVPAIVITNQGVPYIAWTDASTGDTEVYVRTWDGTAWKEVGAGSATGGGVSNNGGASRAPAMIADSLGRIYLIWPDNTNGTFNVMVRRWNGSSWTEVGAGSASGGGISQSSGDTFTPHAAIGADDIPYVVWFGKPLGSADVFTPEIYARRWNGTLWEEVGTGSATGGGISSSNGASAHSSIAITPNNVPYVIWDDNSSGNYEIYVKFWAK